MRFRRATQSRLPVLVLAYSLGAVSAAPVLADYELVDEQSLTNGAQLYEVFCSDCHGSDAANRYDQLYAVDDAGGDDEYQKLIEIVQQEESAQLIVVPEEEEAWPEWAELPDPDAEQEPDEKTEVMNTLSAVIDEVHGIRPAASPGNKGNGAANSSAGLLDEQPEDQGPRGGFEPIPGATNLADPSSYFYGTSEEEIFESIAEGTGEAMPGFRTELGSDEAIMDVVNYIRSFWGEEWLY
jgi:mono/diheme cytochrome c family protein